MDIIGADLFKIEPQVPYSADYNTCIQEAKQRVGNAPIVTTHEGSGLGIFKMEKHVSIDNKCLHAFFYSITFTL